MIDDKVIISMNYDETNPRSIEAYAQKLIGKTFRQICDEDDYSGDSIVVEDTNYNENHENKKRKGGLGEIIEERFFHYKANNDSEADFEKAGVELKVTPMKINKNGSISAKERLVVNMINYMDVVNETFENSHFWNKAKLMLLIYYLYESELTDRLEYEIKYAKLFTPPKEDMKIIEHDFEIIINKVRSGKAHELSGGDTLYLEACPKASTSKDRRAQPYSDIKAKPRAFAFKNSYMTYILNNYIIPGKATYEPILKEENTNLEEYVVSTIGEYKGYSVEQLCEKFDVEVQKKPKNLEAMLVYRMLGIKGNHAEEFVKANVAIKTIRVSAKNTIKESMSFKTFKFKELVQEEWDSGTFPEYLRNTRFLFVVYKYDEEGNLRLKGCQFWNMPYEDLEGNVKKVWEETKRVLSDGLVIKEVNGRTTNNFPKASENSVCHVRPHATNKNDTYELPDGRNFPKQCFWLNNKYILSQLKEELLED